MRGVDANHVAALSSLTSLTSLSIIAVSNQHITNAALAPLTTLSDLRYLKWHAGGWWGWSGTFTWQAHCAAGSPLCDVSVSHQREKLPSNVVIMDGARAR